MLGQGIKGQVRLRLQVDDGALRGHNEARGRGHERRRPAALRHGGDGDRRASDYPRVRPQQRRSSRGSLDRAKTKPRFRPRSSQGRRDGYAATASGGCGERAGGFLLQMPPKSVTARTPAVAFDGDAEERATNAQERATNA
jgi:hypothetical protein